MRTFSDFVIGLAWHLLSILVEDRLAQQQALETKRGQKKIAAGVLDSEGKCFS
jgi:hypothetical protein